MSLKKLNTTVKKVFTKPLDKPDAYENTHRHAVQVELDGEEVWISLPSNKMDALMVEEEGSWKVVGAGSEVLIKYTETVKGDVTYRNCKKSDFIVLDLVEGEKYSASPKAPAKQAVKPTTQAGDISGKKWVDNTVGMGVGAAVNNSVQLLIAGKITEESFPATVAALYTFSEAAKAAAAAGDVNGVVDYNFSLTKAVAQKATNVTKEATTGAAVSAKPTRGRPSTKKPEPVVQEEDHPDEDSSHDDFDDSIPF